MKGHVADECPETPVRCSFHSSCGCQTLLARREIEAHQRDAGAHLVLAMAKVAQLSTDMVDAKEQIEDLRGLIEDNEIEIAEAQNEIAEAKEEVVEAKEEVDEAKDTIEEVKDTIEEVERATEENRDAIQYASSHDSTILTWKVNFWC
jgi:chromosome segregation ATPase